MIDAYAELSISMVVGYSWTACNIHGIDGLTDVAEADLL